MTFSALLDHLLLVPLASPLLTISLRTLAVKNYVYVVEQNKGSIFLEVFFDLHMKCNHCNKFVRSETFYATSCNHLFCGNCAKAHFSTF